MNRACGVEAADEVSRRCLGEVTRLIGLSPPSSTWSLLDEIQIVFMAFINLSISLLTASRLPLFAPSPCFLFPALGLVPLIRRGDLWNQKREKPVLMAERDTREVEGSSVVRSEGV